MSETAAPASPAPSDTPDKPSWDRARATFSAAYLHALEPIIRASQTDIVSWSTSGLIIEPVESGGVILVATDGRAFAAVFDPDAHASRAMRLTIPDSTFVAATPPKPIPMWSEGENLEIEQPEWAQPGIIWAWGLSICVIPKMHLPGESPEHSPMLGSESLELGNTYAGGYRLHPEPPKLNWRGLLGRERSPSDGRVAVIPEVLGRLDRFSPLFNAPLRLDLGGPMQPIIVTAVGVENFVGMVMPCNSPLPGEPIPAWARAEAEA